MHHEACKTDEEPIEIEDLDESTNAPTNQEGSHPMEEVNTTIEFENDDHEVRQNGTNEVGDANVEQVKERRSRSRPSHLKDYIVKLPPSIDHAHSVSNQQSSTVCPLANFVSYEKFTNSHKAFLAAIISNDEPKDFNQAVQDQNWRDAMKKEMQALEENGT